MSGEIRADLGPLSSRARSAQRVSAPFSSTHMGSWSTSHDELSAHGCPSARLSLGPTVFSYFTKRDRRWRLEGWFSVQTDDVDSWQSREICEETGESWLYSYSNNPNNVHLFVALLGFFRLKMYNLKHCYTMASISKINYILIQCKC